MMPLKGNVISIAALAGLFLGACNDGNQTNNPANSPTAAPVAPTTSAEGLTTSTAPPAHGGKGGQVIESGPYHLELLTLNETDGIHLDFFLQKGDDHEAIPNAQVTAQVQLPNGNQKTLEMKYDTAGKHYYAVLPSPVVGSYQVAILSNIKGEKVNARYSFQR